MALSSFLKTKTFRISAGIVLLAVIFGLYYAFHMFNLKHSDLSKVKPAFTVSSTELYSAFNTDEKAASEKFLKKVVEVSGDVAEIAYGATDSTVSVTLRPEGEMSGVICTFSGIKDPSQINVKQGDKVSIRGECSGMLMDVLLNNCVLLEKAK